MKSHKSQYGRICGWVLARAHAKASNANGFGIASYLGKLEEFENAMVDFGERYADLNEADYQLFLQAIEDGSVLSDSSV